MKNISIEERAVNLAHYIIDSKDTVRGAAKKLEYVKYSTYRKEWITKNKIPEYIEFSKVSRDSSTVRVTLAVKM